MKYFIALGLVIASGRAGHCIPLESDRAEGLSASTQAYAPVAEAPQPVEGRPDAEDALRRSAVKMAAGGSEAYRRPSSRAVKPEPSSARAQPQRAELDQQLALQDKTASVHGRSEEKPRDALGGRLLTRVLAWGAGLGALAALGGLIYGFWAVWQVRKAKLVRFGSVIDRLPRTEEPRIGAVLGGRFILGPLLEGTPERAVYEGRDLADQPRTLVRLRKREGLLQKAQAASGLKNPRIAEIEVVFEEGSSVWLAYEPIAGDSLRQMLGRLPQRRYSAEQSLRLMRTVCEALEFAHGRGLLCGPLNPSAILIDKGEVRIQDFGLWSAAADYLSPEQERGSAGRESDLFSLGVCLYEMLTGALPFKGPEAARDRREGRFPPASRVRGLPDGIDAFFGRALNADPVRRFHAASEFLGAFQSLVVPVIQ